MKIGIEAQRIFRRKKHGMDMVALELIRHLQQVDKVNEYFIFVRPDEDRDILRETPNFHIIELSGGPYPSWEQVALPRAAARYGCDVLHCTSNTAPLFCKVPVVITLHDIIYMESSTWKLITGSGSNYQKFGNAYRRFIVPRILKKSRKIITVSDYEKKVIGDYFNLGADNRLVTVYNGVSDYFRPVTERPMLRHVKEKYKLPDEFFFFLGNTHPKKNTPGVLQAFRDFVAETGSAMKLVMIDYDREELEKLLAGLGAPQLIERIVLTGYVSNRDLPAIYSQCDLFLYPSLRESFGIPIIEAMACGCPVVSTDCPTGPREILQSGRFGPLVPVGDPEAMAEAMGIVLDSPPPARILEARAADFSVKASIDKYEALMFDALPEPAALRPAA